MRRPVREQAATVPAATPAVENNASASETFAALPAAVSEAPKVPAPATPVASAPESGPLTIHPTDTVLLKDVRRFGLNVGARSVYGASQHLKNIVPNPGFEAGEYASMLHVDKDATALRVPQAFWDTEWSLDQYGIGQQPGFWDGGEFEFVYGPAKGVTGKIQRFTHENKQNIFYFDNTGPAPNQWDVFIVRKRLDGIAAEPRMDTTCVAVGETRPGSPGKQSFHMAGPGSRYQLFLDSEWRDGDASAGKLLVVRGEWKLTFWMKAARAGDRIRVQFHREGEKMFVDEIFPLDTEWQKIEHTFKVADGADKLGPYKDGDYHPLLSLSIATEREAEVWLDDLTLEPAGQSNPTVFTDLFVARLKELQPGILRNWSSQLGNSLENELAEPFARRTNGFSPKRRFAGEHGFGLHEFLELCNEVGAEPWYVMPPTWSPTEVRQLIEYLSAPADGNHPYADRRAALGQTAPWTDVFSRVHIEFGNEMWGEASGNDPFFGASAMGGERLGSIANDRFALMRESVFFNPDKINLIIGGQFYYPGCQRDIEAGGSNHREIALAPYFGDNKQHSNDEELYYPLFARPFQDVATGRMRQSFDELLRAGHNTGLAVYEINFHTTGGEAPDDITNDFVTGANGALALPLYMLVYQRDMGAKHQCAFTALQYSFRIGDKRYVRLWGLLRDIAVTARKRPTWLGLELVNRVIRGDMVAVDIEGARKTWRQDAVNSIDEPFDVPYVHAFAFKDGSTRSLILFNLNLKESADVTVRLGEVSRAVTRHQIAPESLHLNNESADRVAISTDSLEATGDLSIELPKHSLTALQWTAK